MSSPLSLTQLGWSPFFQQQLTLEEWDSCTVGRVVEQHRSNVQLTTLHGKASLPLIAVILWLGLYPQPVLNTTRPVLRRLEQTVTVRQMSAAADAKLIVRPDSGQDPLDQADLRDGDRL